MLLYQLKRLLYNTGNMKQILTIRALSITALLIISDYSLSAAEGKGEASIPARKTYLPEYRMAQLFPADITGMPPWYDMNPTPEGYSNIFSPDPVLHTGFRQSRGEYLMGSFSEVLYFAVRFSRENTLEVEVQDDANLKYLSRIQKLYGTDLTLCLAGSSHEILPAVTDSNANKEILDRIADILEIYSLSGIDLDWEFPRNDEEKEVHRQFMENLKQVTSSAGKTLSMAASRFRLLPEETYGIPDSINLMTYDFYGRHSTWEGTLEAVEYMLLRYGIPPEKLLMGLPFYGRIFDGFSPDYWKKSQSYRDIVQDYEPFPHEDEAGGFYFNGPATIQKKLELAAAHNLQGVIIWEIGQDTPGEASLSRIVLDFNG
jgi:hypothetical protein